MADPVPINLASLFAKIRWTTYYPGRGTYTLWEKTKGLMPFATRSNASNPNEWFFTPVFHSDAKLATVPRKAFRLVKFDVTCGKKLNDVFFYKEKTITTGGTSEYVCNGSYSVWIPGFPSGYIGSNNTIVSGLYDTTAYDYRFYTSPVWYRDFCGNYYTGETAKSGCFMLHKYTCDDLIGGPTSKCGKACFTWGTGSGCKLNAIMIPTYTGSTGPFIGFAPKPYGFLIGLKNTNIWPASAMSAIFGMLVGVPKSNTIHSMAMYYKCGTKYDLYPTSTPAFPYKNDSSHVKRVKYLFSATDSAISGYEANPNSVKLISVDSNYKYFVIKGNARMNPNNCAIFTPPFVVYSGNSTGGLKAPSVILDSWVSFHK